MGSFDYSIAYHLISDLQEEASGKFICSYLADIEVKKSSGDNLKIGRFRFSIVLLNQIRSAGHNLLKILETKEELMHIAEKFITLDSCKFVPDLKDVESGNVCIVQELSLLPGFRGKGLGAMVMRDFIFRFISIFSVLAVKVVPFQVATVLEKRKTGGVLDDFSLAMRYEDNVFDEETARLKLFAFFQKLGFTYFKDELFYLSAASLQDLK